MWGWGGAGWVLVGCTRKRTRFLKETRLRAGEMRQRDRDRQKKDRWVHPSRLVLYHCNHPVAPGKTPNSPYHLASLYWF